jgi:hypothetical protein
LTSFLCGTELDFGAERLKDSARQQAATGARLASNEGSLDETLVGLAATVALLASAFVGVGVAQAAAAALGVQISVLTSFPGPARPSADAEI